MEALIGAAAFCLGTWGGLGFVLALYVGVLIAKETLLILTGRYKNKE